MSGHRLFVSRWLGFLSHFPHFIPPLFLVRPEFISHRPLSFTFLQQGTLRSESVWMTLAVCSSWARLPDTPIQKIALGALPHYLAVLPRLPLPWPGFRGKLSISPGLQEPVL